MARRITFGRILVLLLVGVCIGVGIFLFKHLSPDELRRQVQTALEELFEGEVRFADASLDLNGVEVKGLEVRYADGSVALFATRVHVAISQLELLKGATVIKQITLSGLHANLRPNRENLPDLPGVLRQQERAPRAEPALFPILVNSRAGRNWITFHGWPAAASTLAIDVECKELFLRPKEDRYELTAQLAGDRVDSIELDGTYETVERTLRIKAATVKGLRWDRTHTRSLAMLLPKDDRVPLELGGEADLTLNRELVIREPDDVLDLDVTARLSRLDGKFGNLYTRKAHGLPFRIVEGSGTVFFRERRLSVTDLSLGFASGRNDRGRIRGSYERDFSYAGVWEDFTVHGTDIFTAPEHLELLLPVDVAPNVIGPLAPGGTFDFEVTVSHRPGFPEKVNADVRLRDGQFEYEGFPYAIDRCGAHIRVETNVALPRGQCDIIEFTLARGPDVWAPAAGATDDLCVRGKGRIETYLRPWDPAGNPEFQEVLIRIANLPFDQKLEDTMQRAQMDDDTYKAFALGGRAHRIEVRAISDDFGVVHSGEEYRIELKDNTAAYEEFPLPLVGLSGHIIKRSNPPLSAENGMPLPELEFDNLRARARGGGAITAHGKVGSGIVDVMVEAKGLVLDADLEKVLREHKDLGAEDLWDTFRPSGKVDVTIDFGPKEGAELAIWIDLAGTANIGGYEEFAYPIHGIVGTVFVHDDNVELSGIRGRLGPARFSLDGFRNTADGVFNLYGSLAGELNEELLAAANPVFGKESLFPKGLSFAEGSRFRYEMWARRPTPDSDPVQQTDLTGVVLRTRLEGVPLRVSNGTIKITDEGVRVTGFSLRNEDSKTAIDVVEGEWLLQSAQRPWVDIHAENIDPLGDLAPFFSDGIAKFLGPGIRIDLPLLRLRYQAKDSSLSLDGAVGLHRVEDIKDPPYGLGLIGVLMLEDTWLQPKPPRGGPAKLKGAIAFKDLNVTTGWAPGDMRGTLHIDDCSLGDDVVLDGRISGAAGKVFDFHLDQLELDIDYTGDNLRFSRLDGNFHGGRLTGEVSVHAGDPGGYRVRVAAVDVNLADMLKPFLSADDPLEGMLEFRIGLESLSGEVKDMTGFTYMRVREGLLFEVPGLRQLISLLARVAPFGDSGARFTDAALEATIRGETLDVRRLHLSTNTNDVLLDGRITLFGDLDLGVRPQVTRLIDLPRLIDIPVLSALRGLWHEIAYEIRLEGTLSSPALRFWGLPWLKKPPAPFIQSPHAGRIRRMRPRVIP